MNKILSLFLNRRGYSNNYLKNLMTPYNDVLTNCDELSDILHNIYTNQDLLVILPDFDCDGVMSGTLSYAGFSELGFNVKLFYPNSADGYGFSIDTINLLYKQFPDCKYIITCDVGVSCKSGIHRAKELGITTLVTDHHLLNVPIDELGAKIIVNPNQEADTSRFKGICGAYTIYKCIEYYTKKYRPDKLDRIQILQVFAGIGTVSDMMPLIHDSRHVYKYSVLFLRHLYSLDAYKITRGDKSYPYFSCVRGLYYFLQAYKLRGIISCKDDIDEDFYGFYLAPLINSSKRLFKSMGTVFSVFFSEDYDECIELLFDYNEERKEVVKENLDRLLAQDQPYAPYVYIGDVHTGICGLVATKLFENKPIVVLNEDTFKGSARSPYFYNVRGMAISHGYLFAGHNCSCGARFLSRESIEEYYNLVKEDFSKAYEEWEKEKNNDLDYDILLGVDGDFNFDFSLLYDFYSEMTKLKPFGSGFSKPIFKIRFNPKEADFIKLSEGKHLKVALSDSVFLMLWNEGDKLEKYLKEDEIEMFTKIAINKFNGQISVNFFPEG